MAKDASKSLAPGLEDFDRLPDSARVALPVVCGLHGISPATAWRRVQTGLLPKPLKTGNTTRWVVADLRASLQKAA